MEHLGLHKPEGGAHYNVGVHVSSTTLSKMIHPPKMAPQLKRSSQHMNKVAPMILGTYSQRILQGG